MVMARVNGLTEVMLAPEWMQGYLDKLKAATTFEGELLIVTCDPKFFEQDRIGVTNNAHAFTRLSSGGNPDLIVLPHDAANDFLTRSAICHEFFHVLHGRIDRLMLQMLDDSQLEQYMQAVEESMLPFTATLMVAAESNIKVEWETD